MTNEKTKVMIVDDDVDVIEQLAATLQTQGYEVFTGASRQEGEELLLTFRPDLAILDLMMEEMDSGFVLCHYLKKLYPDTPVILLTAVTAATGLSFSSPSPQAQSWVKADKVMDKPVRAEQILAEVRRLLGRAIPAVTDKARH